MDTERIPEQPRRWLWISCIWLGFGVVDATQTVVMMRAEGMHHDWPKLFFVVVLGWVPWMIATDVVMRLDKRFPLTFRRPVNWLPHIAACAVVGVFDSVWLTSANLLLDPYGSAYPSKPFAPQFLDRLSGGIVSFVVLYSGILAMNYVLDSRARLAWQEAETARLNEQLSKAQLDALRRQIEPHFLFNTLNGVAGLVREGRNDDAISMIAELSDFLRRVLEDSNRQRVPLKEEMEFAQRYLAIQKARFADRLTFTMEVPAELQQAQVPSLILQPMVENAVKHGIARRIEGGRIRISAARRDARLTISVYNDGPGLSASDQAQSGIGVSNVRTRLQSLYGDEFELSLENQPPDGVRASLTVPFKESV